MKDVVLAIDQGTTGTTALLLDASVQVVASHNVEFPNHYPRPGWVEHDVEEIWQSVESAVKGAVAKAGEISIQAIGITNQRETSLFWDRHTGEPIHRALVWQDRRTADVCRDLKERGLEGLVRDRTGLVLDPYFSGTKAKWLLDHVDGARERAARGDLLFGTIDTWLVWRLSGAHVTDPSNASRTLLFDIERLEWDDELLDLLGVPRACLPRIVDNAEVMGATTGVGFLRDGIPVSGMAGDQQAALFGQACFEAGMAKCTYGTGAFVLLNTGANRVRSNNGLLTTVGWRLGGEVTYALEGSAFIAGAAVQWVRDQLGLIRDAAEIEALAASVPDTGGVVFVPALAGLGAPHWRPEARGVLCGLTQGTGRGHIARAVLEGIALQVHDILESMAADAGTSLASLKVDGGAARNTLLMQFQADVLGVACIRPTVLETTALGSAFLAGLGVGFWDSPEAVVAAWSEDRCFVPAGDPMEMQRKRVSWRTAVEKA
ncbi:MAG: glycerol kinase GlpK [Myxococcota bacterium]|jgi:glycerol kinase|nr:glycerol kinase GlpK [Myxococcota bacterium]